jgi:SAM-dependent methyltransferase
MKIDFIFQPERHELAQAIKERGHFLHGHILDVGAGSFDRYGSLLQGTVTRMNLEAGANTDLVGNAEAIPLPNESYDSILCNQMLGDVFEPSISIQEFFRVLKPNGVILLTESFICPIHDEPRDYWRFTKYSLTRLFKDAGFSSVTVNPIGGYFSTIAQLKARWYIHRFNLYEGGWFRKCMAFYVKWFAKRALRKDKKNTGLVLPHSWIVIAKK